MPQSKIQFLEFNKKLPNMQEGGKYAPNLKKKSSKLKQH